MPGDLQQLSNETSRSTDKYSIGQLRAVYKPFVLDAIKVGARTVGKQVDLTSQKVLRSVEVTLRYVEENCALVQAFKADEDVASGEVRWRPETILAKAGWQTGKGLGARLEGRRSPDELVRCEYVGQLMARQKLEADASQLLVEGAQEGKAEEEEEEDDDDDNEEWFDAEEDHWFDEDEETALSTGLSGVNLAADKKPAAKDYKQPVTFVKAATIAAPVIVSSTADAYQRWVGCKNAYCEDAACTGCYSQGPHRIHSADGTCWMDFEADVGPGCGQGSISETFGAHGKAVARPWKSVAPLKNQLEAYIKASRAAILAHAKSRSKCDGRAADKGASFCG